jgi:hypothetical protein
MYTYERRSENLNLLKNLSFLKDGDEGRRIFFQAVTFILEFLITVYYKEHMLFRKVFIIIIPHTSPECPCAL